MGVKIKPKDFQEATSNRIVEVFKSGQRHVLLADEVGLGKTIIAASVIDKVGQWHKAFDDHFRVVYVCSNINIVSQNSKKLGIDEKDCLKVSESRLSMQHLKIYQAAGDGRGYQQLIPLTPATSFSMTGGCGSQDERALMYVLLKRLPTLANIENFTCFMQCYKLKNWNGYVEYYEHLAESVDKNGSNYFHNMDIALREAISEKLLAEIKKICIDWNDDDYPRQKEIINELRRIFAGISLDMLEPDLVIMDEFQRFRDLITPNDDEAGLLAQKFLRNDKTKVLLLSATPYKPYSTLEEINQSNEQEHYFEFMQVMDFLIYDENKKSSFKTVWKNYSVALSEIGSENLTVLFTQKEKVENSLYETICRTERFNSGVIDDSEARAIEISTGDILSYAEAQKLLVEMGLGNIPVDYIKSSPYLLSFMATYKLKEKIVAWFKKKKTYSLLDKKTTLLLKKGMINTYKRIPPNNARLEKLLNTVFHGKSAGMEKMLWLPPSRPYYKTKSVYGRAENTSKLLLFSAWEMVPRMVAAMVSYESERLVCDELNKQRDIKVTRYFSKENDIHDEDGQINKKRSRSVRLREDTSNVITYPCRALALLYDKMKFMDRNLSDIIRELKPKIIAAIDVKRNKYNIAIGKGSARDYYLLMRLLDNRSSELPNVIPRDAEDLLTYIAIASPAVCALRLFNREDLAQELAEKFVSLFNKPESENIIDLIYEKNTDTYYENVIRYCAEGNFQSLLDEWAYVLNEDGEELLDSMKSAFIGTSSVNVDTYESFVGKEEKAKMRTHFATGYFNTKTDDKTAARTENIRNAFNSPLRPFVLATTSIGQEGLDFHLYCRKIMHWNLPSNPVDLEQREGRINRYQCLALRQSVVKKYAGKVIHQDLWRTLFDHASQVEKKEHSDMVPFWCLPANEDNIKIERIVPMYPFSKDIQKYERLVKVLTLYRLTLGQPRQEELLDSINTVGLDNDALDGLFLNLSPYKKNNML